MVNSVVERKLVSWKDTVIHLQIQIVQRFTDTGEAIYPFSLVVLKITLKNVIKLIGKIN